MDGTTRIASEPVAGHAVVVSLVVPAFNEEGTIAGLVREWDAELERLGVPYELRLYDDGSDDRTGEIVRTLATVHPSAVAIHHANRGHGPTILRGYQEAHGEWILQIDSDGEIGAAALGNLWTRRQGADLVLGYREGRPSSHLRRLLTAASRLTVRMLFGGRVRDVNCPYRLYRRTALARLLPAVPPAAFAPNVILVGLAIRAGLRIVEVPVPHTNRRTRPGRMGGRRLWGGALRAFAETVLVALRAR